MSTNMHSPLLITIFLFLFFFISSASRSTIAFTTLGRSRYNFDIFTLPLSTKSTTSSPPLPELNQETQLTDGVSVNFNGHFPSTPNSSLLLFVSERNGVSSIYLSSFHSPTTPLIFPLLQSPPFSFKDRPSISNLHNALIYVSTHEDSRSPRRSWAAVYSTNLADNVTRRLTPIGVSDFSPSVSPSGYWTAVASSGVRGWDGEVQDLMTDIYVFRTEDGSERRKLVDHGGWPCWADEETLYFHRESDDGWWSVYRVRVGGGERIVALALERITPPGLHAFTPAASVGSPGIIAVATRRRGSEFRHIELVDVRGGSGNAFTAVTRLISPEAHHYNPFISADGSKIGYHRCRGGENGSPPLFLESIRSPFLDEFSLFRIDGSFPSFSHDGGRIAFVGLPGLYVVKSDGSGKPHKVFDGNAFPTSWDWKRKGVIYTSHGPDFATERTKVDVISITLSDDENLDKPSIKKLTLGAENNAFPSPSPDGKWVVFRSGRSGHKNLYIMDALEGESGGIYRLTEGAWTDTMCNWSPDGEWIAFASDRDNPGSGSFAIYMVHPNGTGLRRVVHSGDGGRTNHPWFSPDSKRLVFTSDYGGVSAEPISNPHHYQPYGEIYTVKIDGSDIQRLTQNSYEDGTPTWTPFFLKPVDVAEFLQGSAQCSFDDCHWLTIEGESNGGIAGASC